MIITNARYALVGYFITSYSTRAHGIIVIYYLNDFVQFLPGKNFAAVHLKFCPLQPKIVKSRQTIRTCRGLVMTKILSNFLLVRIGPKLFMKDGKLQIHLISRPRITTDLRAACIAARIPVNTKGKSRNHILSRHWYDYLQPRTHNLLTFNISEISSNNSKKLNLLANKHLWSRLFEKWITLSTG